MTLPQNVKDAVDARDSGYLNDSRWEILRAYLMSQEAEIERLRDVVGETAQMGEDSERCLAAANALLRDVRDSYSTHPVLHARIQTHLQGAGDEA